MQDFLFEIHTEELPPKTLSLLANNLLNLIQQELTKAELSFEGGEFFATPRRLAVIIKKLQAKQKDSTNTRKGPLLSAAYNAEGEPSSACIGFAKSCGITPDKLVTIKTPQGEWVAFQNKIKGKTVKELLPEIIERALKGLPIAKRMRWGEGDIEFVRPIHSVILLYGDKIIPANILGCKADRKTRGHRFMSKGWVSIASPLTYPKTMENQYVISCFQQRKANIHQQIISAVKELNEKAQAVIDPALLDEVTGLVEWPIAILGTFDAEFLKVPREAIICAMQDHQRYFPIVDEANNLMPYFVAITNIKSKNVANVIAGNERVLRARLADAAFFFELDKKQTLSQRTEKLKNILFQKKLGSLYDKVLRIQQVAGYLAEQLDIDANEAAQAAFIAKSDLTTQLVGEFPELQGIAGYYYALAEGYTNEIAIALKDQYRPRFSGDELPCSKMGCLLALADKVDTIVGVFLLDQAPTGEKDPFGLRRAALGILRILIEKEMNLDLTAVLKVSLESYSAFNLELGSLNENDLINKISNFILERLKPWYSDQNISSDVLTAVSVLKISRPYDYHLRVRAIEAFKKLSAAEALTTANKRVNNILTKYDEKFSLQTVDANLFEQDVEAQLAAAIHQEQQFINQLALDGKYQEILQRLAGLREIIDLYFDKVLVMSENKMQRENRLLLLKQLRELFLSVADIALLQ